VDAQAVQRVREVYDVSYRRLVGQLTGVTGDPNEAEDVVMDAFVKAVKSAGEFVRLDNPEAWLRTVAVNAARTRWRRRRWLRDSGSLIDLSKTTYADLEPDRLDLLTALRRLPAAQREVIGLHHLADLPVAEVAETLGVPVGTVKARLSRGRAALAHLLAEHDVQPERSDR
jgi:RNA polymerase sigma-70 factor (ECF subfamily)